MSFQYPKAAAAALLVAGAAIAAAAFGYWKLIYYPTTPQFAIDRFIDAARTKNYDRVYDMVQVPPPIKVFVRSGSDLKSLADRNPGLLPDIEEHRFNNAVISS